MDRKARFYFITTLSMVVSGYMYMYQKSNRKKRTSSLISNSRIYESLIYEMKFHVRVHVTPFCTLSQK